MKYFSTRQTAKILGYNDDSYIRRLIRQGHLEAIKIGRSWGVTEKSIHQLRTKRFIKERFGVILSYGYELQAIADKYLDNEFPLDSKRHGIASAFLGKSYKTYSAVLVLCEKGYGEDAMIIVRSLFENFINLKYILSDNDDSLASRYLDFDFVLRKQMLDYAKGKPGLLNMIQERSCKSELGDMDISAINRKAKEVISEYKFKPYRWSNTLKKMSEDVGRLDQYKTIYALQCQLSHPTPRGMNSYFSMEPDGLTMNIGESENYVEDALVSAFDFFASTLSIVGEFVGWDVGEKLSELFNRYKKEVKKLTKYKK